MNTSGAPRDTVNLELRAALQSLSGAAESLAAKEPVCLMVQA